MAPVCLHFDFTDRDIHGCCCGKVSVSPRVFHVDGNSHFPQSRKGWTHKNKGRRLGKGREEDNFPASHGNEREAELTLP
jgi:hypothetical protein